MFMSDSDKDSASVGGGGGDDDNEEGGGGGGGVVPRDARKKQRGHGCGRDFRKAKQVVLFPFRKAKKQLYARNNKRSSSSASASAAAAASAGCSGKRVGCYLCFTQPPTSESPVNSQTSDPNNPQFTYECLKALVEKNDFYSKECNPYINISPHIQTDEFP